MSQLTPITTEFLFDTSNIRTAIDDNGNPWFCAKDVCAALDTVGLDAYIGLDDMKSKRAKKC